MSNHKVMPEQISVGYVTKFKDFATHPETTKYFGRTIVVITLVVGAYFVYKNRCKIYQQCQRTWEYVRNKFKKNEESFSTMSLDSFKTLNIYVNNAQVVNIHHVKDLASEEGKESPGQPNTNKDELNYTEKPKET